MIIDILSPRYGALGDERQRFTVNNAVNDVNVNDINPPDYPIMRNSVPAIGDPRGCRYFSPVDNVVIMSMGISLPYAFSMGSSVHSVQLNWVEEVSGTIAPVREISGPGGMGFIEVPFTDAEIGLSVYCQWPINSIVEYAAFDNARKKALVCYVVSTNMATSMRGTISMINVPASIVNGSELPIIPFLKVAHSVALS